jgi:PhzF family phenazine biosynthesis protein
MPHEIHLVNVFAAGPGGGNPAPTVADAVGMAETDMQAVAARYGHESGFVLPAPAGSCCDFALRFWVPNHEMEMCGHATVAAVWLLDHLGRLPGNDLSIWTRSGVVRAHVADGRVEISQPAGEVEDLTDPESRAEILSVLGITAVDLAPFPIQNARTSRVKTLIPLRSAVALDAVRPDFARVEAVCARINSTGLYPYAPADHGQFAFDARQFPRSSGYPEDAATGIAAAALIFGLLRNGQLTADADPIRIGQGRAMGHPSEIMLRFHRDGGQVIGCWLGGHAELVASLNP